MVKKRNKGCLITVLVIVGIVGALYAIGKIDETKTAAKIAQATKSPKPSPVHTNPAASEEPAQEAAAAQEPTPMPEPTPIVISDEVDPQIAFVLGNDAYKNGDYPMAEAYYRHSVKKSDGAMTFIDDVRNNLGLALLQQEKNEEALEIYRKLVTKNGMVREDPQSRGYWVNLLVAAHANGISAKQIFAETSGYIPLGEMDAAVKKKPGDVAKIYEAIYYNTVYMDLELDQDDVVALSFTYDYPHRLVRPKEIREQSARGAFGMILMAIEQLNTKIFGQSDPDVTSLLTYIDAKFSQE